MGRLNRGIMSNAQIKKCLQVWVKWVNEGTLRPYEFEEMVYKRGWQEIAGDYLRKVAK